MSEKQKLTLSVNKEVIEKAKQLGINISDITENILKGFTFEVQNVTQAEIYKKYKELFNIMLPLMRKYNYQIIIAEENEYNDDNEMIYSETIFLEPSGAYYSDLSEISFEDINKIPVDAFQSPITILSKYIEALIQAMEKQKERLKEIEMAKKIVEVLSQTILEKEVKK